MSRTDDSANAVLDRRSRRVARARPGRAALVGDVGAFDDALARLARCPHVEIMQSIAAEALEWDGVDPRADSLIFAAPIADRDWARRILAEATDQALDLWVLAADGLRPLALEDLIGRDCPGDAATGKTFAGSSILITGGGGSIGGAIARLAAAHGPAQLTVLDSSEANLYAIGQDLPAARLRLVDVRDRAALARSFQAAAPDIVFHAAALKQVPLVEANVCEGFLTNALGCLNAAELATEQGADFVFVSTDKAVNPSSAMGATKRLGEKLCQALDRESGKSGRRFMSVRLGNVLGSTGSVAPLFAAQIAAGGPLKVTHPDVERYFITIPQAATVLMRAASPEALAHAERGAVVVADMGEPLAIVDLARDMIRLAGLRPEIDIGVSFIGLRPGEKLREVLVATDEARLADPGPGLLAVSGPSQKLLTIRDAIERMTQLARAGAEAELSVQLHAFVQPSARQARAVG